MTKNQARKNTRKLIRDATDLMRKKLERALICGAIDFESYEDDFELPTIILMALLKEAQFQYCPLYEPDRKMKEAENIFRQI